jgi:hypothetical protein
MDYRTRRANAPSWPSVLVLVSALAAAAAYAGASPAETGGTAASSSPQDAIRLESRMSRLEQRIYSVETSVRALEQQSRLPDLGAGRAARDPEVGLLRTEVDALRQRLAEVECGLARVDERTLTAAARAARRKNEAGAGDPCRLDADAPLRPTARP